jgi:uncharacterized membrane protein
MMWRYGYEAGNWLWMAAMMFVFWGALIALAVWAVRVISGSRVTGDGALDTPRKRLASGEISLEDFDKLKKALG